MRMRILALTAALCLLLSACGGEAAGRSAETEASVSAAEESVSASEAPAVESENPTEEPAEDPESSLETEAQAAPEDPVELGRWLWALNEEKDQENYAVDYDMDMTIRVELDGESTTEKVSTRIRQIEHEDGTVTYQSEEQYMNAVTKTWYDDGMVYLSDPYGDYKAPMDLDTFRETYINDGSSDLLELTADDFGTLTGEATGSGYVLTYGDVALDAWMTFSGMFDDALEGLDGGCESFSLNGTVTLDKDGNMLRHDMQMSVSFDIMGMTLVEDLTMVQSVNGYNESVSISAPADDDVFVDMSDIEIPSVFADGFNGTLAQDALHYQDTMTLSVSDPSQGITDVYTQQDDIVYSFESDGLHVVWDTSLLDGGQVVSWSNDSYAAGVGAITDETGEAPYTYDDDSFGSDIAGFITLYTDSFDAGNHYQLAQDGDQMVLTYDIDSDYVRGLLSGYLEGYGTGVDYDEAEAKECRGTMSIWFDMSGLMVSQLLDVSAELTYETGVLSVSLTDQGDVLAMGSDVALTGAGY